MKNEGQKWTCEYVSRRGRRRKGRRSSFLTVIEGDCVSAEPEGGRTRVRRRYSELDFLYSGPFIMWTGAKCLWGENTCYNRPWPQLLVPASESRAQRLRWILGFWRMLGPRLVAAAGSWITRWQKSTFHSLFQPHICEVYVGPKCMQFNNYNNIIYKIIMYKNNKFTRPLLKNIS